MTRTDDDMFEQRLTAELLTPDVDAMRRDYVNPTLQRVARRDRSQRLVLLGAGAVGLATTGAIVGAFLPASLNFAQALQRLAPLGLETQQPLFWVALALALTVTAVAGLGVSMRGA